ncbi:uncharacterized protein [Diabrotica undecimpunctata]|uniref:uncharacterized protein n=1 Tax=Diabrotica undecimpunctata TaxID=50387 RepID=UPI003B63BE01
MAPLPKDRVTPSPPFYVTGMDYAGPFQIKSKYGRIAKLSKCYVCLFICCSTKAIYIELVSELTKEAFTRRGKPLKKISDNGTQFVGANKELKLLGDFLLSHSPSLTNAVSNEGINWNFIPAKSPNFGGLWEAGVKSCKKHLKRILGNCTLTFEDFYTTLVQIEAILNSRPLCPLSSSPDDFESLTPSHFLIGRRLT